MDVDLLPSEIEVADAIYVANSVPELKSVASVLRRLAYQRDRFQSCLRKVASHSVCCDARHMAERVLAGGSVDDEHV